MAAPKKRNRAIYSCIRCRKRKLKCDRQKPCGQCTTSSSDCRYLHDDQHPKDGYTSELFKMFETEKLIHGKFEKESDKINGFEGLKMLKPDRYWGRNHLLGVFFKDPTMFSYFEDLHRYMHRMAPSFIKQHPPHQELKSQKQRIVPGFSDISLTFVGTQNYEILFKALAALLPPREVTDELLELYFKNVGIYFPILDRNEFEKIVDKVYLSTIGSLKQHAQFQFLALLFIVLRLAQVCGQIMNEDSTAYTNHVSGTFLAIADKCLYYTDMIKGGTYAGICCIYLARLVDIVTPEDGNDGGDGDKSGSALGVIIQNAYSLGLDEPSYAEDSYRQTLWALLSIHDVEQSIDLGRPLNIYRATPRLEATSKDLQTACDMANTLRAAMVLDDGAQLYNNSANIQQAVSLCNNTAFSLKEARYSTLTNPVQTYLQYRKSIILTKFYVTKVTFHIIDQPLLATGTLFEPLGTLLLSFAHLIYEAISNNNLPWLFRCYGLSACRRLLLHIVWYLIHISDDPVITESSAEIKAGCYKALENLICCNFPLSDRYFIAWKLSLGYILFQVIDENRVANGKLPVFGPLVGNSIATLSDSIGAGSELELSDEFPTDILNWPLSEFPLF